MDQPAGQQLLSDAQQQFANEVAYIQQQINRSQKQFSNEIIHLKERCRQQFINDITLLEQQFKSDLGQLEQRLEEAKRRFTIKVNHVKQEIDSSNQLKSMLGISPNRPSQKSNNDKAVELASSDNILAKHYGIAELDASSINSTTAERHNDQAKEAIFSHFDKAEPVISFENSTSAKRHNDQAKEAASLYNLDVLIETI
jgi:hypothetical protein